MEDEPEMENGLQSAKTGTSSRIKTTVLVFGVIAVGVIMALIGQNQKQCGCGCIPFGTGRTSHAATPGELGRIARPRLLGQ